MLARVGGTQGAGGVAATAAGGRCNSGQTSMDASLPFCSLWATVPACVRFARRRFFGTWLAALSDKRGRAKILVRVERLARGNAGQVAPVGSGVSELKIDFGPGYRLYFQNRGGAIVLLLCGGDKSTQSKDIARAKALARDYQE